MRRMLPLWYAVFHHINAVQLFHCTGDEPLGYSPFLPIMRKAAINLLIRIRTFMDRYFHFSWVDTWEWNVGS